MTPTGNFQGPPRFATNPSPAPKNPGDWSQLWKWFTQLQNLIKGVGNIVGTHAQRAGFQANQYPNALYYETDRTVTYQSIDGAWVYVSGVCEVEYPQFQAITDLGENDKGFIAFCSNPFFHFFQWGGANWQFAPWDMGSGWLLPALGPGNIGAGWLLCKGQTVDVILSNGTTTSTTLPNLVTSPAFPKFGTGAAGVIAPVAPSLTVNSLTPAGTVAAPAFTGTPETWTTQNFTVNAGGSPALIGPNPYTPAGTVAAPAFTGTPVTPAGTVGTGGEPSKIFAAAYFRV